MDIVNGESMSIQTYNFHTLLEVENWDQALELIKKDPGLAHQQSGPYMSYPLTTALMHQPPYELVNLLMKACPSKF